MARKKKNKLMNHTKNIVGASLMIGAGGMALGAMGSSSTVPAAASRMVGVAATVGYASIAMEEASKIGKKRKRK